MNNKLQRGLSLADDGKCGPRWMEITSQEKCEEAANSLGLKFKLQRDNTRAITGCIATEVFEKRGNRTSEKAICQSEPKQIEDVTEASHLSARVHLKRTKRNAGKRLSSAKWIETFPSKVLDVSGPPRREQTMTE